MIVSSHISADLQTPGYPPLVHAVQGEQYSRQIKMTLYSGGVAWTVPGGTYIAMRYEKPDGTHGYYDTLPDGTKAWSAEGNMVSIYVAPQMLTAPGVVQGQLEIIQNTSILASFPLRLKVAANLAATLQKSEDYVNWVEWMEEQITQIWEDAVASGELTGPQGPPPTKLGDVTDYQSSPSGDTIPTGEWTETIPAVPQGQYLWTRVTTTWDSGSPVVSYTSARQGLDGTSVTRLSSVTDYQVGESGELVPTGEWSKTIPAVPQGKFLWTRRTQTYSSGPPTVDYSVVRQPVDGTGSVSSVFGISPGPDGDVPTTGALEALGGLSTSGGTMTGPINMNGHPITGLNDPTEDTQAARKSYVDKKVSKTGDTMTGPINMNGHPITGLNDPTEDTQAARKSYVDKKVSKTGDTMTGPINMNGHPITGLNDPTEDTQAARKSYVDKKVSKTGDTMTGSLTVDHGANFACFINRRTVQDLIYELYAYVTTSGSVRVERRASEATENYLSLEASQTTLGKPLNLGSGGTGATTAAEAMTNLGKVSGTYTGMGETTERTIDTGGTGNLLLIYNWANSFFALVVPRGAYKRTGNTVVGLGSTDCAYVNGTLTLTTTDACLNASGVTYNYICI